MIEIDVYFLNSGYKTKEQEPRKVELLSVNKCEFTGKQMFTISNPFFKGEKLKAFMRDDIIICDLD